MKWLKEERYKDEYGIALFNNYAFMLARAGQEEESKRIREELIEKNGDDPAIFPQIQILIRDLIDQNTPDAHAKAKKWCDSVLDNPNAPLEFKQEAKSNLHLIQRIELGLPTDDLSKPVSNVLEKGVPGLSQKRFVFRLILFFAGFLMIIIGFYLKHKKVHRRNEGIN